MPRTKSLNAIVTYVDTDYIIKDLGLGKSPRFELYNTATKTVAQKSNNPMDFDEFMKKVWKKAGYDISGLN